MDRTQGIRDLQDLADNLWYKMGTYNLYFLVSDGDLDGGLQILNGDIDVMDMCAMHVGKQTIKLYIDYLVGNVSLANVEVFNDMEMDMDAILEESTDGEDNESGSDDARSISTENMLYFNDGYNSDDECTAMRKLKAKSLLLLDLQILKDRLLEIMMRIITQAVMLIT
ncbi:hypothetical protein ACH5RR_000967 [Cinchona calisaya]|uniref:Uncharacterized protein n=1 Tax=Cinchona calisaya TaxID=153742 RepID=A0ABD3B2B4_9GENT